MRRRERKRTKRKLSALLDLSPDAILGIDGDNRIVLTNAHAEQLFGYTREELYRRPAEMLLAERYRRSGEGQGSHFESPDASSTDVRLGVYALRRDGSEFPAEISRSTIETEDGSLRVAAVRDITDREQSEAIARLAAIVESSDDAIIGTDLNGTIVSWNEGAERIYGYTAREVIGRSISILMEAERSDELTRIMRRVGRGERVEHFETVRVPRDGSRIDVSVTVSPIRDAGGRVTGASTIAREVTDRKRLERAREQALADFQEAQRLAKLGSWSWNPRADEAIWSAEMYRIFGRDPEDGPSISDTFLSYVHPEDRERIASGYSRLLGGGPGFELDFRIVRGDGSTRTLHASGHEDRERPRCYVGTVQDITELRAAERAARAAEHRFRRTFDNAPIGMALVSLDGRVEQANAALATLCGRTRSELEGMPLRELVHPGDIEQSRAMLGGLLRGTADQLAVELRFMPAAGAPVDISLHGAVLRDAVGESAHLLYQFQDVTERRRFEEQLQFMADHDPLTGLLNRRKFEEVLDRHIAHTKRYGADGALLVLDLDNFKSVNDTLGHSAGDELIVSIAGVLRERLRDSDVLARLGGDEFAVLLSKSHHTEATQVAKALQLAVGTSTVLLGGERKRLTTSIGVATFDASAEEDLSGETMLIAADLAMYDAKEAGGDRYALYSTSEHRASRTKTRITWANRIEHALENDRFTLVAQPILDLRARRIHQHELLLRMLDERDEVLPPATFLAVAERFGLIGRLDEWVASRAIELIKQRPSLQLEVNISGRSLGDHRLLEAIEDRLRASRIDPAHLIFEVTETAAVANITHAQLFAQRLRDLGCRFALDDFGAGFGSFYYLKHLPFDYVKIDGEFVQHAVSGHVDRLVIEAVVGIAQGLGKETIAEFVTNEKTQRMVQRLGVDYAQGHHIGKPILLTELLDVEDHPSHSRKAINRRLRSSSR